MKTISPSVLLGVLLLTGCERAPEAAALAEVDTPNPTAPRSNVASPHLADSDALIHEKGRAVVQEAFSVLSTNLLKALAAGGPSNAIPFCSVQALPLTETVSQNYAVEVRRVSHRVRNAKNAPNAEEASVLEDFQSQLASGVSPRSVVIRSDTEANFYAPIVINNALCLTCHGEPGKDLAPETTALLTKLYPNDAATGFRMNDLRGMWVVKIRP